MRIVVSIFALFTCVILAHVGGSSAFLDPNCGIPISRSNFRPRIAFGQVADMFGNPWMALVRSMGNICGGSLITNRFVLTAAHCLTFRHTVVYLGEFDRSSRIDCSRRGCLPNPLEVPVDQQIPHPRFVNFYKDDIALLRLARPVRYTNYIRPICLLTNSNPLNDISRLTVTGWGKTETGRYSNVLKTHTVTQLHRAHCSEWYRTRVDASQICAGNQNSNSCFGDSGSPVSAAINYDGTSRIVQLGIMSFIKLKCDSLEVYTNVVHFMGWIEQVVRRGGSETSRYPILNLYGRG